MSKQSKTHKIVGAIVKDTKNLNGALQEVSYVAMAKIRKDGHEAIRQIEEDIIRAEQGSRDAAKTAADKIKERSVQWGSTWQEFRDTGLEDMIHAKAHRLCNCPPEEKVECLVDLVSYAAMRWSRLTAKKKRGSD